MLETVQGAANPVWVINNIIVNDLASYSLLIYISAYCLASRVVINSDFGIYKRLEAEEMTQPKRNPVLRISEGSFGWQEQFSP